MSEPYVGQLRAWGCNFAPRGWSFCEGQLLSISQNQALYSLLGTTYGGDGRTTFALPDLRGRVPIHQGTGQGLSPRTLGEKGGSEQNTMTTNQMPAHTHTGRAAGEVAGSSKPTGNALASATIYLDHNVDATLNAGTVTNVGGQQPFNNVQPYMAANWTIALVGIFPPRN